MRKDSGQSAATRTCASLPTTSMLRQALNCLSGLRCISSSTRQTSTSSLLVVECLLATASTEQVCTVALAMFHRLTAFVHLAREGLHVEPAELPPQIAVGLSPTSLSFASSSELLGVKGSG